MLLIKFENSLLIDTILPLSVMGTPIKLPSASSIVVNTFKINVAPTPRRSLDLHMKAVFKFEIDPAHFKVSSNIVLKNKI